MPRGAEAGRLSHMKDAEDSARLRRRRAAGAALERWSAKYPAAARDLERMKQSDYTSADIEAWERKHPDAAAEHLALTLYSREVMRKMRLSSPAWEPPEWPYERERRRKR